jgi:hypothetical protein
LQIPTGLTNAPAPFVFPTHRPQERGYEGPESIALAPPRQLQRFKAAGDLSIRLDGEQRIARANGDHDGLQDVRKGLEYVERPPLLALASGQEIVHLVDHDQAHPQALQ